MFIRRELKTKNMKVTARILLILSLVVGLSACQSDETIFDRIIGYTWVGDLGFSDAHGYALESGITLSESGFGVDEQYYYDNGEYFNTLNIRWDVNNGTLFLDYGNAYPLLELRAVYVSGGYMTGKLYANNVYEGDLTLKRL